LKSLVERSVAIVLIHWHRSSTLGFSIIPAVRTRSPAKNHDPSKVYSLECVVMKLL
jgi:hypothetical protein